MKKDKITQHKEYVEFLKKKLDSKNYKNNVPEEEYEETKKKYEKAKLVLRILK